MVGNKSKKLGKRPSQGHRRGKPEIDEFLRISQVKGPYPLEPLESRKTPKGQAHPGETLRLMTEAHVALWRVPLIFSPKPNSGGKEHECPIKSQVRKNG